MTDQEKESIVQEVLSRLSPSSEGPDYRTGELAELIGMNATELSRIRHKVHGFYLVGTRARFRRAEINYRRSMGLNVFKDK